MKTAQLSSQDLQCGCDQVEMHLQSTFVMSGEEMDLDMKTHGNTNQEEIYSDFKKSHVMMEIFDLERVVMDSAELKKALLEEEGMLITLMYDKKNEEIDEQCIMISEMMEIYIMMTDVTQIVTLKWGGNALVVPHGMLLHDMNFVGIIGIEGGILEMMEM